MSALTVVIPYYDNPTMLSEQYRAWQGYPEAVKSQIDVVLVDDGSPSSPAVHVPRPGGLPPLRIFRVLEDLPWHQHGARNLGAHVAESPWLFLTDMDHVLPGSSARALLELLDRDAIYTFHRLDAPNLTPKRDDRGQLHPHVNTFALRRDRFWAVGGYDEDCVGYGTDGYFRRRLYAHGPSIHLDDVPIVRYPREVVADANTQAPVGVTPKAFRDQSRRSSETQRRLTEKQRTGDGPKTLDFTWERVL